MLGETLMAINDPPPDGIPRKRSSSELRNIFKSRVGQVRTAIAFRRKTYNVKEVINLYLYLFFLVCFGLEMEGKKYLKKKNE